MTTTEKIIRTGENENKRNLLDVITFLGKSQSDNKDTYIYITKEV